MDEQVRAERGVMLVQRTPHRLKIVQPILRNWDDDGLRHEGKVSRPSDRDGSPIAAGRGVAGALAANARFSKVIAQVNDAAAEAPLVQQ